ncbi:MAG: tetratricopeptide repeat protein [Elusimicrobiota bacterium]
MRLARKIRQLVLLNGFSLIFAFSILGNGFAYPSKEESKQWQLANNNILTRNWDAAASEYRSFLLQYPRSSKADSALYMLAEIAFQQKRYAQSAKLWQKVISSHPADRYLFLSANYRLGECYYNLKKYLPGIDYFMLVKRSENKSLAAEATRSIGLAYLALEEKQKAEEFFLDTLQFSPSYQNEPSLVLPLGLIYLERGDYQKALKYFSLNKEDKTYNFYKGVTLRCLNETIAASQMFKDIVEKNSKTIWAEKAQFQMGEAYFQAKEYDLAKDCFTKVFKNYIDSPLLPGVLYRLGCIYFAQEQYPLAVLKWKELVDKYPDSEFFNPARFLLAESSFRQENVVQAMADYAQVASDDLAMDVQYKIIYSLALQDQYEPAVAKADKFLKDYQWGQLAANVYIIKGYCLYKLSNYQEAILEYQKIIDRFPNSLFQDKALYLMSIAYFRSQLYAEIITNVYQILKLAPPSPTRWQAETFYWIAEAYYLLKRYDLARITYEMVLKNYSNTNLLPYAQQGVASCYEKLGNYEQALLAQAKVLALSKEMKNKDVQKSSVLETADILFNKRDYEKAIAYYEEFVSKNSNDAKTAYALYQEGTALHRLEYFSEAIKKWLQLINNFPQDELVVKALFQVGKTFFGLGDYAQAESMFRKIIEVYAQDKVSVKEALLLLAQSFYNQGKIDQAIEQYKVFLEKNPTDTRIKEVNELLEMCYYRQGREKGDLLGLVEKFPQSQFSADVYWEYGAEAFNDKNYSKALEYMNKLLLNFPESERAEKALFYQAESYYCLKDYPPAVMKYKNYIQNFPKTALTGKAQFQIGVCYFEAADYVQSAIAFSKFIEAYPESPLVRDALLNIPLCYRKDRQPLQAVQSYLNFIQRYPKDEKVPFLLIQVGTIYEEQEDYLKAVENYQKISADKPERWEALLAIGRCYQKIKAEDKMENVLKELSQKASLNNKYRLAGLFLLAELYEKNGTVNKSIELYRDIVQHSEDKNWTGLAQEKISSLQGGKQ